MAVKVGQQQDVDTVALRYEEEWWLRQLAARNLSAIWLRSKYPHNCEFLDPWLWFHRVSSDFLEDEQNNDHRDNPCARAAAKELVARTFSLSLPAALTSLALHSPRLPHLSLLLSIYLSLSLSRSPLSPRCPHSLPALSLALSPSAVLFVYSRCARCVLRCLCLFPPGDAHARECWQIRTPSLFFERARCAGEPALVLSCAARCCGPFHRGR